MKQDAAPGPEALPASASLDLGTTLRAMRAVFARTWRGLVVTAIVLKIFVGLAGLAGASVALSYVMRQTGHAAVTNTDIARLLLTPKGLLLVFCAIAGSLLLVLLEQGALMVVTALLAARPGIPGWTLVRAITGALGRVARLSFLVVAAVLAIVLPPLAVIGLVYRKVLGAHDINFYLHTKPPEFLGVCALAAALLLAAGAWLLVLYVRWCVVVPIVLFDRARPVDAMRRSRAWVRGNAWPVAGLLVAWHAAALALSMILFWLYRVSASGLLSASRGSAGAALTAVVLALLGYAIVSGFAAFVTWTGHALLVLRIYGVLGRRAGEGREELVKPSAAVAEGSALPTARLAAVAAVALVVAALVVAGLIAARFASLGRTEITAHRGASKVAPENTASAVRKAIEAGADWAEIDVQETKDNVVVVLHDRDLMRLGGDPRRLSEMTFDELRTIDVGSKFSPEFAGEKVPSLAEVIDLSRGKIKLNIELKYYGPDPRLAPDVAKLIHEARFERQCFVASLDYPSLEAAKAANPDLQTAAIVTARLGDVTRLPVDHLSVNATMVSFDFLAAVRHAGRTLHVWTIDDVRKAELLMGRGVDNVITNDPAAMVQARARWEAMPKQERLLHAARNLLGLKAAEDTDQIHSDADL